MFLNVGHRVEQFGEPISETRALDLRDGSWGTLVVDRTIAS